jgi:hypothetical protein
MSIPDPSGSNGAASIEPLLQERELLRGRLAPKERNMKVILWIIGIIFLIGLLVVFGIGGLVF